MPLRWMSFDDLRNLKSYTCPSKDLRKDMVLLGSLDNVGLHGKVVVNTREIVSIAV